MGSRTQSTFPSLRIIMVLFIVAMTAGCDQISAAPDDTINAYLGHINASEFAQAYTLLSEADQQAKSLEDYVSEQEGDNPPMLRGQLKWSVSEVRTEDTSSNVDVQITKPDSKALMAQMLKMAFQGGSNDPATNLENIMASGDLAVTTETQSFHLINESGEWRILFDWAAAINDTLAYRDKIEISGFEARYFSNDSPGFRYNIKNNGDRTLIKVKVTVFLKDENGNNIAEEDDYPIHPDSFEDKNRKPLKPNYMWKHSEVTYTSVKNVSSDWKAGNAEIVITEIEFANED